MRLLPSDPDVETIVSRIQSGDIDLQPEFQRGEVWGKLKRQKLIDSILREWHVPSIHVIENRETRRDEVLDGQQRLAAIRDFVNDDFPIDGGIEPISTAIESLNGKFYSDLPQDWKRKFNKFTIRVFRIVDYGPAEPAEIFFRLNQPTSLTGAEQRNAASAPARRRPCSFRLSRVVLPPVPRKAMLLEGQPPRSVVNSSHLRPAPGSRRQAGSLVFSLRQPISFSAKTRPLNSRSRTTLVRAVSKNAKKSPNSVDDREL